MQTFINFIQGGLIGIGNIIPGVSGATVALILGIYKKLIAAIDSINAQTVAATLKFFSDRRAFTEEMKRIQASFLISIFIGVLCFVYAFSFAISYFLDFHHDATYSFFCGLILASVIFPFRYIHKKTWQGWTIAILAVCCIISLSLGVTTEQKIANHQKKMAIKKEAVQEINYSYSELGYYFIAGAIAISAMILPGVSGSFILLLMGSYFDVLLAIKQFDIPILSAFGLGCLLGLISFTKILKFLLEKYESELMFFLTGLILGSLYSIWPFKSQQVVDGIIFYGENILPSELSFASMICCLSFIGGIMIVLSFYFYEKKKEQKVARNGA